MKNQKQNKINPTDTASFSKAAEAAALETARRISVKLGCTYAVIGELDQAADNAVSVFKRNENMNGRYTWKDGEKIPYEVIDVLINPAKVPAALKAQAAYELVLPTIEKAKACAPELYNPYWNSLVSLVKDSHAVSTVFRSFVRTGGDLKVDGEPFVAVSNRRNDRNGELNAVRFGSKTGVDRLLVHPAGNYVPTKRGYTYEKWAGVVDRFTPVNIERIVESAVEMSETHGCVSVETVDDLYKSLSDSQIWEGAAEAQDLAARKAYVRKLAGDLDALGLMVIKGVSEWIGNKLVYSIAVTVKDDRFKHEAAGVMDMIQRKESLEALHKALVK